MEPVGAGFQINLATDLDTLPTWGMGIEAGLPTHLTIQLSDGTSFEVDLGNATTVGDVIDAIEVASRLTVGGADRVSVTLNADNNGLDLQDLTYVALADDLDGIFSVKSANGSFASIVLGIMGEDDNDDGVLNGRALHGESLANRLYVQDFNVDLTVQTTADDIDATANFGIVEIGIENGTGEASASLNLSLIDPDSSGKIYLERDDRGRHPEHHWHAST